MEILDSQYELNHKKLDLLLSEATIWSVLECQGELAPSNERHDIVQPFRRCVKVLQLGEKLVIGLLEHLILNECRIYRIFFGNSVLSNALYRI